MNKKLGNPSKINNTGKLFYAISIIALISCLIAGIFSNGATVSNLLFNKNDVFMDFFNSIVDCSGDAYGEAGVIYPPLVVLFYKLCSMFFDVSSMKAVEVRETSLGMIMIVCFTIVCYVLLIKLVMKYKDGNVADKLLFAFCALFSYPMIYLIERGNILILVIPLLLYYVCEYDSESSVKRHLAYICLAICVAIKIYPVFFGLLLLKKKNNYKNIAWCIFYGILFFFVPFIFVGGFSQLFVLIKNILYTSSMFGNKGYGYKVSISNTFGLLGQIFNHSRMFETVGNVVLVLTVIGGLFLILFGNFKDKWKLYAVISLILILVPGFSYIYSIAYMIIPLLFFLNKKEVKWLDYVYLILFAFQFIFLIATKDELFPSFNSSELNLNIATLVESFALLAMLVILYIDGTISFFIGARGKKIIKIPVNAVVCVGIAGAIALSGIYALHYTPKNSGFSITSVECFTPYDEDENTLNEFYSYTKDTIGDSRTVAFPRVEFLSEIENENLSFFDLSYDSNSLKKINSVKGYDASYIIIYNVSNADIRYSDMQFSYSELKTYLSMYKELSRYCWSNGYEKIKSYTINDGIELAVWEKTYDGKNTSWRSGGKGTKDEPFLISTAEQLYNFSEFVNAGNSLKDKYVMLTNDIDMSGIKDFKPIGFEVNSNYFKGIFNGNGYSINNLTIAREGFDRFKDNYIKYDIALFGKLGGTVENLIVEDSTFSGYCSAVFARSAMSNKQTIINCISKNNTITGYRCGELVDDYGGAICSTLALNNKCKGTNSKNIIGYSNSQPITLSVYTNTLYKYENKYYLSNDVLKTPQLVDSLNESAQLYNGKIESQYLAAIHRLCYNGDKEISELKSTQKPLELCEWKLSGSEPILSHR